MRSSASANTIGQLFLAASRHDAWFHQRAGQDDKSNVARVFVAVDDQRGVVGFYSLSSFTLALADLPPEQAKRLPRYDAIPAALIGRLARDERVRGEGVGDLLLADAVHRVLGAAQSLAVFAIVVDAKDEAAGGFLLQLWICTFSKSPFQIIPTYRRCNRGDVPCAYRIDSFAWSPKVS